MLITLRLWLRMEGEGVGRESCEVPLAKVNDNPVKTIPSL